MSSTEMIQIFDPEGNVTDSMSRAEAEKQNHTTENVLVFIFNSLNRVWVQLRPDDKSHYPGLWDVSACGGVLEEETPDQAATRETKEETSGLKPVLHHIKTFINEFPAEDGETIRRRFSHLYVGVSDDPPKPNEEVAEFVDWDPKELRARAVENEDKYIPSFVVELDIATQGYADLQVNIGGTAE